MSRFVVLHHRVPPGSERADHWDLMLEQDGRLLTWAVAELPRVGLTTSALRLPDHRLEYLQYEGPLSGNRGVVRRCWEGEYQVVAFDAGRWELDLQTPDQPVRCTLWRAADSDLPPQATAEGPPPVKAAQRWMVSFSTASAIGT